MAKPCSGSTAPSLGLRSRTCPYDASTSKSVPRYFLIVFALAGDSTMTRLSAIAYAIRVLKTKNRSRAPDLPAIIRAGRSMRRVGMYIGYQIFESLKRLLLPGLARQHHQNHPLQLLRVQLIGIERQHPIDHDLPLLGRQYPEALQCHEKSATFGRQPRQLAIGIDPQGPAAGERSDRQRRPVALRGEVGQPIERALNIRVSKAHTFQVARQM